MNRWKLAVSRVSTCAKSPATGYGLDWFSGPLQPRYLAEKFLKERWVKESFIRWVQEYIRDGIKARSLDFERKNWLVGRHSAVHQNYTEGRALRYLITHCPDDLDTPEGTYDALPSYRISNHHHWHCPFDSEFISPGYDYDPAELGWLVAIQRRFSELVGEVSYA